MHAMLYQGIMRGHADAEDSCMAARDLAWPRALELVSLDLGAQLMHLYGLGNPEVVQRTRQVARRCLAQHWDALHGTWTDENSNGASEREAALLDAFDALQPLGRRVTEQIRGVAVTLTDPPSKFTNEENWHMLLWHITREGGLRELPLDREHRAQLSAGLDSIFPSEADYAVLRRMEDQEEDVSLLTAWDRRVVRRLKRSDSRNPSDLYSYSTRLVSTKRAVEYLYGVMSASDIEGLIAWSHEKQRTRPLRYGTLPLAPLRRW